jgi:hypothetical protein
MKKFLLLALLFGGLHTFAQKTFEVYNYTAQTVQLADIATKVFGAALYPEFHSKPSGLIVSIPPGGSYILYNASNIYRFPYVSPASSPTIPTWERLNSASSSTYLASAVAYPLGTSQVFKELFFFVGGAYNNISVTSPTLPLQPGGWQADYIEDNPAPNVWFYTIVIY